MNGLVVFVSDRFGCDALFLCSQGNWSTMFVCCTDVNYVLAFESEITGINVSGNVRRAEMTDVKVCIRVRNGSSHDYVLC